MQILNLWLKNGWKNDLEISSTIKVDEHSPCGYSMSMIWRFGIEWYGMEIRHDVSRREDCMKNFCEYIREHAMKVINLKKKKMIPLTNEQHESYEKAKICKKKVRII